MKRNFRIYVALSLLLASLSFFMSGCKDVFEQDISNKQLHINGPADGAVNSVYNQLFWWNKLEGATQYSIQIVTPSFDSVKSIITDTILGDVNKFYKTITPGKYQWRIRAENGSYKTNYQVYSLTMLESALELQSVVLVSPTNNSYRGQGQASVDFTWEKLYGAKKYLIQIDSLSGGFGNNSLKRDTVTDGYTYTYSLPKAGTYKWRIKAKNDTGGETEWTSAYKVTYINTTPDKPTLNKPVNDTTRTAGVLVNFTWNSVTAAASYKIRLYKPDNTLIKEQEVTDPKFDYTFSVDLESIYWNVTALDAARQESAKSDSRTVKFL